MAKAENNPPNALPGDTCSALDTLKIVLNPLLTAHSECFRWLQASIGLWFVEKILVQQGILRFNRPDIDALYCAWLFGKVARPRWAALQCGKELADFIGRSCRSLCTERKSWGSSRERNATRRAEKTWADRSGFG